MASPSQPTVHSEASQQRKIRVMLVDDSVLVRGLFERTLLESPEIEIVAKASDGELALKALESRTPDVDVIVLDIEMPKLNGLEALPKLMSIDPTIQIIMASTLTKRNADISLQALNAGAKDYIPKPSSMPDMMTANEFKRDLLEKVITLGRIRHKVHLKDRSKTENTKVEEKVQGHTQAPTVEKKAAPITLRSPSMVRPRAIGISSSTGGPQALTAFLKDLPKSINHPIFITQHMPKTFTTIFSVHLSNNTGRLCCEAQDGDRVEKGMVYLAPGDFHMTVVEEEGQLIIRLNQNPPVNFCRPAADPMLQSLSTVYGPAFISVVLTGMGSDGCEGSRMVVERGGSVVAQDEATSAVWGMPGAVAKAGLCTKVLPLDMLAQGVAHLVL